MTIFFIKNVEKLFSVSNGRGDWMSWVSPTPPVPLTLSWFQLLLDAQTSPFLIRTSRAILHVSHSPQQKVIRASLIIVP